MLQRSIAHFSGRCQRSVARAVRAAAHPAQGARGAPRDRSAVVARGTLDRRQARIGPPQPAPEETSRPNHLVFTGSMDWLPNEDAMLFFCREILPMVRAVEPAVSLAVVGRAPTPAVQRLGAEAGVTVTGRVDDVRPYMRDAAVYIVPLRIGGGTRLKIFEAMGMAKAVVSTTVGAEGLGLEHGRQAVCMLEGTAPSRRSRPASRKRGPTWPWRTSRGRAQTRLARPAI